MPDPSGPREIIVKFREGGSLSQRQPGRGFTANGFSLDRFHRISRSNGIDENNSFMSFPRTSRMALPILPGLPPRPVARTAASLDLFIRVEVPEGSTPTKLAREFSDMEEVEYAVPAGSPNLIPPEESQTGFPLDQDYLGDSGGVNAKKSWNRPGGNGENVNVCDCEYGYHSDHPDLANRVEEIPHPFADPSYGQGHGTNTLGLLAPANNGVGITGICHGSKVFFSSETNGRTGCIDAAIDRLSPGDILILEMQAGNPPGPAEYDIDVLEAIKKAVFDIGIIVVEAAGNGGKDLKKLRDSLGRKIWKPGSSDEEDSGAIIVGAGTSPGNDEPHARLNGSNAGKRVDCQGWGENVVTTGGAHIVRQASYTNKFGGTSSAAAMVAGSIACLQGAFKKHNNNNSFLDPLRVRDLLRNSDLGESQNMDFWSIYSWKRIGPLPDLLRLLDHLGIPAP